MKPLGNRHKAPHACTPPPQAQTSRVAALIRPGNGYHFSPDERAALFEEICRRIEEGESLRRICSEPGMPMPMVVVGWKESSDENLRRYARARAGQARHFAERINEIAADAVAGKIPPDAARVAIDAFKWTASKLDRASYGDQAASTTVNVGVQVGVVTEEQRAKAIARKKAAVQRRMARMALEGSGANGVALTLGNGAVARASG